MIRFYDMASCQPVGDEQTGRNEINEPRCEPRPALRLMSIEEAVALKVGEAKFPGAVIMTPLDSLLDD